VRQQRYLPLGSTADASQTWGVPLAVRYRDGDTVREEKAILSGARSRFDLEQAQSCPVWVMPNAHGNGYYRFSLTPQLQDQLSGAFAELDEREQRMYADSVTAAYGAGQLTPEQLLKALPQFTTAKVRQTVTAGMDSIGWMEEYLLRDEAQRSAFRAQAAALYRPRLDALGLAPRDGEDEDQRLLRNSLVNAFAFDFKDQKTREYLKSQGDKVLGLGGETTPGDGRLHKDAVPQELRGAAIAVAVAEGGPQAFDLAERHFRAEQDPSLRGQLLGAMSRVQAPALAERTRAFVFEEGLLRRNEIFGAVGGQVEHEALRPAVRKWIDEHFSTLEAKLSPAGAALIHLYSAGMCSSADAAELESTFAARMAKIEGGPLELKQQVEGIRLCEAQLRARQGQPLEFAQR
jgi:alanyl aminopeptidase